MTGLLVVAALLIAATALGLAWRATTGRARRIGTADGLRGDAGGIDGVELGGGATLLQFSSEFCSPCRATARLLGELADDRVRHVELDVAERRDLADRFGILQTPTTLVLDADGYVRARIGGAPRRSAVIAELEEVLA